MKLLTDCLAVGAGGALGAVLRFLVGMGCGRWFGGGFPLGTFVVNITGSLFLGWFLTVIQERVAVADPVRLAIAVGFVGAYTTFSTFSYESSALLQEGAGLKAGLNIIGSLAIGLLAVRLGIILAQQG